MTVLRIVKEQGQANDQLVSRARRDLGAGIMNVDASDDLAAQRLAERCQLLGRSRRRGYHVTRVARACRCAGSIDAVAAATPVSTAATVWLSGAHPPDHFCCGRGGSAPAQAPAQPYLR